MTNIKFDFFPLFLVFYEVITYLSNDAYIPALPEIARDLITTHHTAQLTFTVWFLGGLSVQLFLGPLSDRYGRRAVLLWGGACFVLSSILCAFAPNILMLLIGRFIQGAAVPSMIIAGYAAIHESYEYRDAILILARMQSVNILAPALGPLLGSILLLLVDWRWIFGLLSLFGTIALYLLFIKMPDTLPVAKRDSSFHLGRIAKQYFRLLKNLNFMRNILTICMLVATMIGWMIAGPFLVISENHFSPFYFGIFQAFIFGSFMFGNYQVKRYMHHENLHIIVNSTLVFHAASGFIFLLSSIIFPHSLIAMVICLMMMTFGAGLCSPVLSRLAIEASTEPMGARMSMISLTQFASAALATLIVSAFYNGSLFSLACISCAFSFIALAIKTFSFKMKLKLTRDV